MKNQCQVYGVNFSRFEKDGNTVTMISEVNGQVQFDVFDGVIAPHTIIVEKMQMTSDNRYILPGVPALQLAYDKLSTSP
jgi:hypothetical protein